VSCGQALQNEWLQLKVASAHEQLNTFQTQNLIANLRNFSSVGRFKRAAMHLIAHRLDDEDVKGLRSTFMAMDANGDGMLTLKEMQEGCRSTKMPEASIKELEKLFEKVDSDKSGSIDYTEFIASMLDEKLSTQTDAAWEAFRVFDIDGNGKISAAELKQVLSDETLASKMDMTQAEMQNFMNEADADGDGEIDFDEFMAMLKGKNV